jgi:hypothetical protein
MEVIWRAIWVSIVRRGLLFSHQLLQLNRQRRLVRLDQQLLSCPPQLLPSPLLNW